MTQPQDILMPLTDSALFLTLTVRPGGEDAVRDLLPGVAGMIRGIRFPQPDEEVSCVVGIGSDLWDRLFTGPRPAHLHPFREIAGERHHAPATPGDLFLHVRSRRPFPCFELTRRVVARLGSAVEVADEVHGFRYYDRRDLLGFVDGTENPTGETATAAVIVDDDPAFVGGSYLVVQKYLHDLEKWTSMPVEAREHAVGRTMLEDIELPDDVKPGNAHIVLTSVTGEDGRDLKIVRDNMPFGSIGKGEYGTYFAGYAADPGVIETMLTRMFIGVPPGHSDQLLDVSTAVTGALFFVPPAAFLRNLPAAP